MDSQDSEKITELANNNQEPLLNFSLLSLADATPSPNLPSAPSRLESLPPEIMIEVCNQLDEWKHNDADPTHLDENYRSFSRLARVAPAFTKLAQGRLYRHVALSGKRQALNWLNSPSTFRRVFPVSTLSLYDENPFIGTIIFVSEQVLDMQTSALRKLRLGNTMIHVDFDSLAHLSGLRELELWGSHIVNRTELSPARIDCRLTQLSLLNSHLPTVLLSDIINSSAGSLRRLDVHGESTWNQLSPLLPLVAPTLEYLALYQLPESPTNINMQLEKLTALVDTSAHARTLSQLVTEFAAFPHPTVKHIITHLDVSASHYGDLTPEGLERLLALPSMKNLTHLILWLSPDSVELSGDIVDWMGQVWMERSLIVEFPRYDYNDL